MSIINEETWIRYKTKMEKNELKKNEGMIIIFIGSVDPSFIGMVFGVRMDSNYLAYFFILVGIGVVIAMVVGYDWPTTDKNLKQKDELLHIIRTLPPSFGLNIEVLAGKTLSSIEKHKYHKIITKLIQDDILLGQIDYNNNKIIPHTPELMISHQEEEQQQPETSDTSSLQHTINEQALRNNKIIPHAPELMVSHQEEEQQQPETSDTSSLQHTINEQALRIAQLEETIESLERVQSPPPPQTAYECSICRREIKEGELIWADSDFYVFHSPHIKEWIRVNATHPITKVKLPQDLEIFDPNVVLIDGKLMNLEQAMKRGLV